MSGGFSFTVTDLAKFLGKSPATLRGWEKKGLFTFPRDAGGDRKFSTKDVRSIAKEARILKRIPEWRLNQIEASITLLQLIERENKK